ncbi:MAG: hypothetical protein ACRD4O_05115 [Bryobacteraceae bacterium]
MATGTIALPALSAGKGTLCGWAIRIRLVCALIWQQGCETAISIVPQLPCMSLQQACSAAVARCGSTQIMAGVSSDRIKTAAAPSREIAVILFFSLLCGWALSAQPAA